MNKYKTVLFDLDGTVVDSTEGIYNSVRYAADRLGLELPDDEDLGYFVGPPLHHSFAQRFGLNREETERAVATYREHYRKKGLYQCSTYAGIDALIRELKQAGCEVYIATAKPTPFAKEVISHIGLSESFKEVIGSNLDGTRGTKGEIISHILDNNPAIEKKSTIMIGDTHYDIEGANANELDSAAVTYGPGDQGLLQKAGPSYSVDSAAKLREILLG